MPLFAHILIVAAYTVLSSVAGLALFRLGGASIELSMLCGLALTFAFSQIHAALSRGRALQAVDTALLNIRNDVRKLNQRSEALEVRVDILDETLTREVEERREALVSEMRELEDLIGRLGKSFEARLSEAKTATPPQSESRVEGEAALVAVQDALRENRVDLHLQPIVSLPQRRVCFYEGFTRLRNAQNQLIMPGQFLAAAQSAGLLGVIDNMLLFRCVQIVRRLNERDRRVGVFCNIAMSSLEDENFFPQFLDFMRDNRDLSGSLIFEIGQNDFAGRTPVAARNIGRLVDLGFRFSLDKADTLHVDLPELQGEGVRFLKVSGDIMMEQLVAGGPRPKSTITREIAPEDVSAVFSRYGVDLIVEKVEDEKMVVEVLDYHIPFGQGHVFGAPRPIKGTLLEETTPPSEFMERARRAAG